MTRVLDKLERAGRRRAQHASESDFDALNLLLARLLDRQSSIFLVIYLILQIIARH
ncbi:hypothetical protein [Paraburkholderia atlantica]|uniref:Uncharacterized protein n=1 Tax=Paraburkholderia atlantica TaxID=2654982 RepID=D5W888_PARAM|nr:hypothetical protein [Paraburkholderia atlantica]ADG15633.1 hypothetical protein BC1002_1561 [Paraburkholderia atlantica]MBB5503856.1 hypothetical protein [Paraburkholderia atlantica]